MADQDLSSISIENNLLEVVKDLRRRIEQLERRPVEANSLDEISGDLGIVEAGEFRSHADPLSPVEPGDGFSGIRMSGQGMDYCGVDYAIVGVSNDGLTFGLKSTDGTGVFAGGLATIGADAIDISTLNYIIRHTAVSGAYTRIGKLMMTLPDGSAVPAWALDYTSPAGVELLGTNAGFEEGDFTDWTKTTETDGEWVITTNTPQAGTYSVRFRTTSSSSPTGVLTSANIATTAGLDYLIGGYIRFTDGGNSKIEIKWYTAADALVRTDLLGTQIGSMSPPWVLYEKSFEAPATSTYFTIVCTVTNSVVGDCFFDSFYASAVTVAQRLWITDDGIQCTNGMYPKRAAWFWDEVTTSVTMTVSLDAAQAYQAFWYNTAANAADGDEYYFSCVLAKGTYTIYTLGYKYNYRGKVDYYMDGVVVGTGQDWYSAGTANITQSIANVSVTYDGYHILKIKVNGKNGSSSDYAVAMTKTWIKQAAD